METISDIYYFCYDLLLVLRDLLHNVIGWLTTTLSSGWFGDVFDALVEFLNLIGLELPPDISPIYLLFGAGITGILAVGFIAFITNVIS